MRNFIKFYVNGSYYQVNCDNAFKPLSQFIRENLYLIGTKEVCCEGDCGACTVLVGKSNGGEIVYKPLNSCILYVYQLDNAHIITVEGIKYAEDLNPIQKSIVKNNGTQCGYCTSGVINTLYSYFDNLSGAEKPEENQVKKALTGNLCRCTGYEGIIRSALDVKPCDVKKINMLYPQESLEKILEEKTETIEISDENQKYIKPVFLEEAINEKTKNVQAKVLAGGTDIHVLANKKDLKPEVIIDISDLKELKTIDIKNDFINIGAAVTIAEAEKVFGHYFAEFYTLLEYYASPQIKNVATLVGNIANASPVGDSIPFLMAMNASIEVFGKNGKREININNLYKGYKTLDLSSDEIITNIKIPLLKENEILKLYKVSKRKHLDISTFSAAFKMKKENNIIQDFSFVLGGVAAYTIKMKKVEEFIKGKEATEDVFVCAGKIIEEEISPISDVRGSKEYRINLAKNILKKFYLDIQQNYDKKQAFATDEELS
jgi:xanthine dehydrogenase small subunit